VEKKKDIDGTPTKQTYTRPGREIVKVVQSLRGGEHSQKEKLVPLTPQKGKKEKAGGTQRKCDKNSRREKLAQKIMSWGHVCE